MDWSCFLSLLIKNKHWIISIGQDMPSSSKNTGGHSTSHRYIVKLKKPRAFLQLQTFIPMQILSDSSLISFFPFRICISKDILDLSVFGNVRMVRKVWGGQNSLDIKHTAHSVGKANIHYMQIDIPKGPYLGLEKMCICLVGMLF